MEVDPTPNGVNRHQAPEYVPWKDAYLLEATPFRIIYQIDGKRVIVLAIGLDATRL